MDDGTLLVVEIARGTLTRIATDGAKSVVADVGGGPNGAAIGPDGRCYVCNNGGLTFFEHAGRLLPGSLARDYSGGWIDAVDLETGRIERLYDECGGQPLNAPNDIVFDGAGGFWFTDLGKYHREQPVRDLVKEQRPDAPAHRNFSPPHRSHPKAPPPARSPARSRCPDSRLA